MQSKTFSCKPSLGVIRKDLTRFWPVWSSYLFVWALALPVQLLNRTTFGYYETYASRVNGLQSAIISAGQHFSLFATAFWAILSALTVWSYLHNPRSASLYHSLPVTREGMFLSHWIAGLSALLLPQLLIAAVSLLITLPSCGLACLPQLGCMLLAATLQSLLFFGLATLVGMFTGQLATHAVLYGLFSFMFWVCEQLVCMYGRMFLYGVNGSPDSLTFLSPFVYLLSRYSHVNYRTALSAAEALLLRPLALYGLAGLVLSLLALLLYRARRTESAGDTIAVPFLRPVAKYGFTFGCALVLGWFFQMVLFQGTETLFVITVSLLLGGSIGYWAAAMLLKKSFRVFHWDALGFKGWLCAMLALAVLVCGMRFDLTGQEKRVPAAFAVKSVNFSCMGDEIRLTEPDEIETVRQLHKDILTEYYAAHTSFNPFDDPTDDLFDTYVQEHGTYPDTRTLSIDYVLKNGKVVERTYNIFFSDALMNDPTSLIARVRDLMNDPLRIAEASLPSPDAEIHGIWISVADPEKYLALESYQPGPDGDMIPAFGYGSASVDAKDQLAILEAMREDVLAGDLLTWHAEWSQCYLNVEIDWQEPGMPSNSRWLELTDLDPAPRTYAALLSLGYLKAVE